MYQGKKKEKSMIITSTVYVIVVYPVKMAILLENRKKHSKFINWSCSVTTFRIQICFFGHYFFSCLCNINFPFLFLCPWRHILYQSGLTLVSMYFFFTFKSEKSTFSKYFKLSPGKILNSSLPKVYLHKSLWNSAWVGIDLWWHE